MRLAPLDSQDYALASSRYNIQHWTSYAVDHWNHWSVSHPRGAVGLAYLIIWKPCYSMVSMVELTVPNSLSMVSPLERVFGSPNGSLVSLKRSS